MARDPMRSGTLLSANETGGPPPPPALAGEERIRPENRTYAILVRASLAQSQPEQAAALLRAAIGAPGAEPFVPQESRRRVADVVRFMPMRGTGWCAISPPTLWPLGWGGLVSPAGLAVVGGVGCGARVAPLRPGGGHKTCCGLELGPHVAWGSAQFGLGHTLVGGSTQFGLGSDSF